MRREVHEVWAPTLGAAGTVCVYGHWGRPVLVFPSEQVSCPEGGCALQNVAMWVDFTPEQVPH